MLIESDISQAMLVQQFMANEALTVFHATSTEGGIDIAIAHNIDLVVIDWKSYVDRNHRLIDMIRSRSTSRVPVICLAHKAAEMVLAAMSRDVIDEYILKPFSGMELAGRIRALSCNGRRSDDGEGEVHVGNFVLDPLRRRIALRGTEMRMMPKEYELTAFLFRNVGKIVSRQLAEMAVWGRALGEESRTLDTHIYRLRKRGLLPENGVRLSAVYTRGYRLEELADRANVAARVSFGSSTPAGAGSV
nr:response regulator transcription factor [Burkholderia ambifaria]